MSKSETEMLCGVLEQLETAEEPVRLEDLHKDTQTWWAQYKAAAEQALSQAIADAKKSGLAKLTPEERAALGLNSNISTPRHCLTCHVQEGYSHTLSCDYPVFS